jgi:predicted flap endonuclease-1-like 5' DNA nuclease
MKSNEERGNSTQAALQEKDEKIFHLSRELENWQNRLPPLIERFRERDAEAKQLDEELNSARARIDELERGDDAGATGIEPVDREQLGDELDASNDPTSVSYTGLERVLAGEDAAGSVEGKADNPEARNGEAGGLRDNLRMIKGIGPTIEKTLNELGIFRFNQIAEMSEYDIYRVARRLKGFSTRIYREDWIGQARNLQLKQSGT